MVWPSCAVGPPSTPLVEGWDEDNEVHILCAHCARGGPSPLLNKCLVRFEGSC